MNKNVKDLLKFYEVDYKNGSPNNPTTQNGIELFNRTFIEKLRKVLNFGLKNWEECVQETVFCYNNCWSRATKCTPNDLFTIHLKVKIDKKYNSIPIIGKKIKTEAINNIKNYKKNYESTNKWVPQFKIDDCVYYAEPGVYRDKLTAEWRLGGKIQRVGFKWYEVMLDNGKRLVVLEKFLQKGLKGGGEVL
ncbi:hypothetical protein COBT_002934 [Conglomerata obtusa]